MEMNDPYLELMTANDVAELTRSPVSTVRYWRYRGTGPRSFRIGKRIVYRRIDVQTWLTDQLENDKIGGT
jgi:predicted DNA-binding transcriptional regulator AlpA